MVFTAWQVTMRRAGHWNCTGRRGASISGATNTKPVPPQVIRFLNNPHNRSLIRAVIASGNSNFGVDFGKAGDLIAAKCHVPYVYRFELMGLPEDAQAVRAGLLDNAEQLGLLPLG